MNSNPPGAFNSTASPGAGKYGRSSPPRYPSPNPQKHDDLFPEEKWRDLWAAILYYVYLGIIIAIGAWSVHFCLSKGLYKLDAANVSTKDSSEPTIFGIFEGLWIVGMMGASILLAFASYLLINTSPKHCIVFAFWGNIGLQFGFGIYFLMKDILLLGIFSIFFALILILMYFMWRKHIPLTAELLKTVTGVARQYPAMFLCCFLAGAASVGYLGFVVFIAYSISLMGKANLITEGAMYGLELLLVFSIYWTEQIISNVFHTIVSGVMATFYFVSGSGRPMGSPTAASAKRALTYSFGSIAFGSLIVALIQMARYMLRSAAKKNSIGGAIVDCLLKILEDLVEYFNYYAYIYVAIYGKPFMESAKATWKLVKSRGLDVIINDNLAGTCVWLFAFLNAFSCSIFTYIVFTLFRTYKDTTHQLLTTWLMVAIVFFAAVFVTSIMLNVVTSGVSATFVCLAEDPAALKRTKPELYTRLESAYANVFNYWRA